MKNIKYIALIGMFTAATLSFSSCSEDFLKPDPLSFYEPGTTFTTEAGLRSVVATLDRQLRNYVTYYEAQNLVTPFYTMYLHTDLAVAGKTDQSTIWADPAERLTPTNGMEGGGSEVNQFSYFWSESYEGIKSANTITNYIGNIGSLSEETKNVYLGRAYFHRSFRYMHLIFMFKDVPLVTKLIGSPKFNYHSTSRKAILEKLVEDMEFAVKWVPAQKELSEVGMVNKEACKMLLAKLYLATKNWDGAIQLMNEVIAEHPLVEGNTFGTFITPFNNEAIKVERNIIWDLHRPENKLLNSNTELLMGMPNRGQGSSNSFVGFNIIRALGPLWDDKNNMIDPNGKQAVKAFARNNKDYKSEYDYLRAIGRGTGYMRPTYYAQYGLWMVNGMDDTGDLRHNREMGNWVTPDMLRVNNPESKFYGQNLQKAWCKDTIRDWYGYPHYKIYLRDHSAEAKESSTQFNGASSSSISDGNADWYLYRTAEAYLLRAEAKYYKGDASAVDDVNEVRRRAQCKQFYTTVTIGDIVDERARELYLEEWRYPELSRISYCLALSGKPDEWGNVYDVTTYDKQTGTDEAGGSYWYQRIVHYNDFYNKNPQLVIKNHIYSIDKHNLYLPVPQSAIDANRNAKLRQNYGYDGYDETLPMWETWQEAVADEIIVN